MGSLTGEFQSKENRINMKEPLYENPILISWLYDVESLSCKEIANFIGCDKTTVYSRMDKYGIKRRTRRKAMDWYYKWLNGKTYEEISGIEKGKKRRETQREILKEANEILWTKHKDKMIDSFSKRQIKLWQDPEYRKMQTEVHKGILPSHKTSYGVGGFRDDLGHFVRSTWEANVCRVLKYLGVDYEYEPITFDLGNETYTSDLRIQLPNGGGTVYYEIKGYYSEEHYRKINLFKKYYPNVNLVIIDEEVYLEQFGQLKDKISNWKGN